MMSTYTQTISQLSILFILGLVLFSCGDDDPDADAFIELSETQRDDFNTFFDNIEYSSDELLDVQSSAGRTIGDEEEEASGDEDEYQICANTEYNVKQNFEELSILKPTDGIIWPGAVVRVNQNLLDGLPDPVGLRRSPSVLSIDLPGISDYGVIEVAEPTNSTTNAAIDQALSWWNDNAYEEGYVNAANSSFSSAVSYNSEQLAVDLGINAAWIGGSASAQFALSSSAESKVAMINFYQVFYKVSMDVPETPADVFSGNVSEEDLNTAFDELNPPGYIHSVSYGRIILFRMETSENITEAELKGAIEYSSLGKEVSAELESKYENIVANSSVDVFTIGGNASVATLATEANDIESLRAIITGENALYSIDNTGVPIAYTVRYLKDNSIAELGYNTDYVIEECQTFMASNLTVKNSGAYVAKYTLTYDQDGSEVVQSSGGFTAGVTKSHNIPANATNIEINAIAKTGLVWNPENTIFKKDYDNSQGDLCFTLKGTTLNPKYIGGYCE